MPSIAGSISSIRSKTKSKPTTDDASSSASALSWKAADDGGLDCVSPVAASKVVDNNGGDAGDGSVVSSSYANMEENNVSTTSTAVSSSYVNMDVVDDDVVSVASKFSVQSSNITQIAAAVFPKLEKLPWTTFLSLFIWAAIPAVVYILLFTQMGFGESFYYALSHQFGGHAYIPASIMAGFGFFFYILDIDQWNTKVGNVFRGLSTAAMFVLLSRLHPNSQCKVPTSLRLPPPFSPSWKSCLGLPSSVFSFGLLSQLWFTFFSLLKWDLESRSTMRCLISLEDTHTFQLRLWLGLVSSFTFSILISGTPRSATCFVASALLPCLCSSSSSSCWFPTNFRMG